MTRSSRKAATPPVKPTTKRVENSWILLVKEDLFENDNFSIITLPHPGNENPAKYCLDNAHKKVYEIVTFSEPYRSWFIGDSVKSDGSMLLVTPVNALFLVLPRLREQCSTRAVPLEDLLSEKGFNKTIDFITNLDSIADLKGAPDMKAYKYNEKKTLDWLEGRVRKLAEVLRVKNVHVTSGAVSSTFVSSTLSNDDVQEEFYLKYAHGIISEYLQDDLEEALEKRFDFKPEHIESIGKKRKSEANDPKENIKRVKREPNEIKSESSDDMKVDHEEKMNLDDSFTETKKPQVLTAKEKARQKAASGTKTISSFFFKSPKIKNA